MTRQPAPLRRPVLVAAFEGWNDAGDAASTAVAHLDREWKGEVFAALDAEDYYDFQVNRPTVFLENGVRKITWPTTRLSVADRGLREGLLYAQMVKDGVLAPDGLNGVA